MEFDKIIQLIQAVSESSLTKFEMEEGDLKISMKTDKETKGASVVMDHYMPMAAPAVSGVPMPAMMPADSMSTQRVQPAAEPVTDSTEAAVEGNVVKAPLVGTFYASASPDGAPYVKVGDLVSKGQTLGIVEAMKLMNEIESEYDGTIAEILVQNEDVVEYGQPMFVIR